MSLNKLISKYLDSELTSKEDAALRSLLSEDEVAKDKFDAAVHLHIAFREDAKSIKAPEGLVRETEDIVLMEILNQPTVVMTSKRLKRSYFYSPYVLGMLVIFFLSSVIEIHDLNYFYGMNNYSPAAGLIIPEIPAARSDNSFDEETNSVLSPQSETALLADALSGQSTGNSSSGYLSSDNEESASETIAPAMDIDESSEAANGSSGASVAGPAAEFFFTEPIMPVEDISSLHSDFESAVIDTDEAANNISTPTGSNPSIESSRFISDNLAGLSLNAAGKPTGKISSGPSNINNSAMNNSAMNNSAMNNSAMNNSAMNNSAMMNLNQLAELYEINDVQIATFAGTDFYRNGVESKGDGAISHVSQSIAYGVGNISRIGVEFGYTQYTFDERMTVAVPAAKASAYSSIEVVVVDPTDGEGNFIAIPIVFQRQQQLFWGSAFYEHTIFDDYGLSLIARGGLGGSSDGFLGYTRLFGKLEIISGVFFNLGTEFRMFMSKAPQLSQQTVWKETGSWIYGLQFKL